jgi:hypothetical protein
MRLFTAIEFDKDTKEKLANKTDLNKGSPERRAGTKALDIA